MPLHATAHAVAAVAPDGRTMFPTLRSEPPLALRLTPQGLTVVASAYGPLGGDTTKMDLEARSGAHLEVRTAGAQVALPGASDTVSAAALALTVGPGASLRWLPQPLVLAEGAEHRQDLRAEVADTGHLLMVETLVLGRHGERGGRYRGRWRISYAGVPLLASDLDIGVGAPAGWDGPAVLGDATVLLTALVAGPGVPRSWPSFGPYGDVLALAGPGAVLQWCGTDTVAAARAAGLFLEATRSAFPLAAGSS